MRVVEGDRLRAVAFIAWSPSNSSTLFLRSRPRQSPASGSCPGACAAWPPRSRRAAAVRQVSEARVADHVARVARDHKAAGVPLVRGQGQLRREALRLHQRLTVDHDELALVRPAVRRRKALALWLPSSRSSGPLSEAALMLDTCSLLHVRKRSSEKSEVLVTMSVLEAKSCTVPELVTSPQTTLPVDTLQSRLSQSSGVAEVAPVTVSVAPVSAPVAVKLAAVAEPEAVSVPVDTLPTVKFPALAVLL